LIRGDPTYLADAYVPAYMAVLGTIPKPATEDYGERIEKGEVWILEVEGEPTGVVVLEEWADHLLIYSIAVKPDAQGKGYGTALLGLADRRAIGLGLHQVRLYTNERMERNLRLYRRHGFVEVGNDRIRVGRDRCSSTWLDIWTPLGPRSIKAGHRANRAAHAHAALIVAQVRRHLPRLRYG